MLEVVGLNGILILLVEEFFRILKSLYWLFSLINIEVFKFILVL